MGERPRYRLEALLEAKKLAEDVAVRVLAAARTARDETGDHVRRSEEGLRRHEARMDERAGVDRTRGARGLRVADAVAATAFRARLEREREALEKALADRRDHFSCGSAHR